ncbi:FadR/GntR family transcriptional regulator [Sphingopyxis panaciterrulae]|uniref:DNA-binding FadR family transcriptional regulator n=1 Tax=Sphingopyxis panaciterrulae TaxID=462372 RepID=A0A7W9B2M5_9SPHN|nr:GntR family transcriptional regulator [Sphingopyxis panaciterrulae]MBB5705137.1 DNA-binding FadR family transcriptional regulator [Sphingopyxis panaciterrulae]
MLGAGKRRRKLGEVVAERIVDEIVRCGWKEGEVLGTEADFMERFRISRATFREAVRQLEWHGAAGMRRGVHGGLVVKAPPRHAIVYAVKTYFELTQIDRALLDRTAAILREAPRLAPDDSENQAIGLFLEALDSRTISDLAEERMVAGSTPKLSEITALRLVQDIEKAGAVPGTNLGNEGTLQQCYGVSRAVLREALRPLELHEIVRVKTGARGGVIIRQCDPAYTVELTATYLAYSRIPLSHLWEAQSCLEIAAVEDFTRRADAATLPSLQKALDRLDRASAGHYLAAACEFHQIIADHSGNRALALFVGVALRYGLTGLPKPDEAFLPALKRQHREMVAAVAAGDGAAAKALMQAMFDHSRRWIARIERDRARRDARLSAG